MRSDSYPVRSPSGRTAVVLAGEMSIERCCVLSHSLVLSLISSIASSMHLHRMVQLVREAERLLLRQFLLAVSDWLTSSPPVGMFSPLCLWPRWEAGGTSSISTANTNTSIWVCESLVASAVIAKFATFNRTRLGRISRNRRQISHTQSLVLNVPNLWPHSLFHCWNVSITTNIS